MTAEKNIFSMHILKEAYQEMNFKLDIDTHFQHDSMLYYITKFINSCDPERLQEFNSKCVLLHGA